MARKEDRVGNFAWDQQLAIGEVARRQIGIYHHPIGFIGQLDSWRWVRQKPQFST